jgi:sugar/nucleoside kinase (ribokinase family)
MNCPVPRFVAVGDLTADIVVAVQGLPIRSSDFQLAEEMHLEPGGSANLLILLSRLGASAIALGTLGADFWGERVFEILQTEGVEVSLLRREGTTTVAVVLVDAAGGHSFVGSYGKGDPLTLGERESRVIAGADALFASGYSLAESRLRDLTLAALEDAGRRGIPRFFDPGPAFLELQRDVRKRVLASSDILLLTEGELRDLSPTGVKALLRSGSTAGSAERPQAHTVVVKRGAAGCRVYTETEGGAEVPGLAVAVRDTTAAGDCFDAGYIWAYVEGRSVQQCARLANCAGAAAVGKLGGGRNVPSVEELREMIVRADGDLEV